MRFTAILVAAFYLSACAQSDDFSRPTLELQSRLDTYSRTNDAKPVIDWVTQYHGEAPGHQMYIDFVTWGNAHQQEMYDILYSWPDDDFERITDLLKWAARDSGQELEFRVPE